METEWASHCVQFGKDRTGIKPDNCDKTHIKWCTLSPDHQNLITACEFSLVNVFDYPVTDTQPTSRSYAGHSQFVLRAEFSSDGKRLFTVGGEDKAII